MILDKTGDGFRGLTTRLLVLLIAMVVAGFVLPSPSVSASGPEPFSALGIAQQRPALYRDLPQPSAPTELIVRSLDIDAPILPLELDGTVLTPPSDPTQVGWWTGSAKPGAKRGNTVITGHTVHTGGGAMDRLGTIGKDALVQVRTADGVMNYRTTKVFVYSKEELAENAVSLFRQDRARNRLVLITCTDWNGSDYDSNSIVFAEPLGVRNPPRKQTGNDRLG